MKQKIHMQDQVTNRIDVIMEGQSAWAAQLIEDVATFSFIIAILALGVLW